ncbi:hypothetical protein GEMRC1_001266 [Eukaryota sp. GEM-RC1]
MHVLSVIKKEYPVSIKVAAEKVTFKAYAHLVKESDQVEARSTTDEFLQEQNPQIDGPQSWESWTNAYRDDPTVVTTAIPTDFTQFFCTVENLIDNEISQDKEAIFQILTQEILEANDHA